MIFTTDAETVGPWVCGKMGIRWIPGRSQAIGKIKDGRLVAGVLYEDCTGANVVCHIAGEPGWACREFLGLIYDYPFNQLKCRRITVPVHSDNEKSIRLVEHMGFTLECKLAQAIPEGDILLYRMFREECRYLRGRYALPA